MPSNNAADLISPLALERLHGAFARRLVCLCGPGVNADQVVLALML